MLQSLRRCLSEWPSLMAVPISSPSAPAPPSSRASFFHKITGIHVLPGVSLNVCTQGTWLELVLHEPMGWAETSRGSKACCCCLPAATGTAQFTHLQVSSLTGNVEKVREQSLDSMLIIAYSICLLPFTGLHQCPESSQTVGWD